MFAKRTRCCYFTESTACLAVACVLTGFLAKAERLPSIEVLLNETATLQCQTLVNDDVDWMFNDDTAIYESREMVTTYRQRFSASRLRDNIYMLTIKLVQSEDAGFYTCIERMGAGGKHKMRLEVMDKTYLTLTPTAEMVTVETGYAVAEKSSNYIGAIVSGVLCAIVLLALVVVVVVLYCRFRKGGRQRSRTSDSNAGKPLITPTCQPLNGKGDNHVVIVDPTHNRLTADPAPVTLAANPSPDTWAADPAPDQSAVDPTPESLPEKGPLYDSMNELREKLEFYIDIPDVITRIHEKGFLDSDHVNSVVSEPDNYKRVGKLLSVLLCCREETRERFLHEILEDSDVRQTHVARYIIHRGDGGQCGDERPLDKKLLANLNIYLIVNEYTIHDLNSVVDKMTEEQLITMFQQRFIKSGENSLQRHQRLVQVLTKRSVKDFVRFTELVEPRQRELAEMLRTGVPGSKSRDTHDAGETNAVKEPDTDEAIMNALRQAFEREY